MASVPFMARGMDGYAENAAFCWLPKYPRWFRLALAWIPRIAISAALTVMSLTTVTIVWRHSQSLYNARVAVSRSVLESIRQEQGISSQVRSDPEPTTFQSYSLSREDEIATDQTMFSNAWSRATQWFGTKQRKPEMMLDVRQNRPSSTSLTARSLRSNLPSGPSNTYSDVNERSSALFQHDLDTAAKSHEKILRGKLSRLLVYPSMYACLWLVPLVHVLRTYSANGERSDLLLILAVISRCLMGSVNSLVFLWLEFPNPN
ncbi:G protein-coupled glucose receptor regulating Gpa2 C-term [Ascochyta lentis]